MRVIMPRSAMFPTDPSMAADLPSRHAGERISTSEGIFAMTSAVYDSVSDALIGQIRRDGYGVLTGGLSEAEVAEINAEALRLCRGELGDLADPDGVPQES